ncbi:MULTISPECIES: hypothetical protein [unclassified Methylobacterium]|uniref:hypothetical protein n=1 Tax=unclassified Methylobacterium TaxID=2615210 RepID=UPI0012E36B58|nr:MULTISPECIES: hypothetical protein [unclassified Methylobacterium]
MDIQTPLAAAIVAELKCRAEASEHGLRVAAGEPDFVTRDGRVNLDERHQGDRGRPGGRSLMVGHPHDRPAPPGEPERAPRARKTVPR